MKADVARDLGNSAYDFLRVVSPAIRHLIGEGRIQPVEATIAKDFRHDLDVLAGIDAWQLIDSKGVMRGLASRVQYLRPDEPVWNTFTIRKTRPDGTRTEFDKRMRAIMNPAAGYLLPAVTVMAYLAKPEREGSLISAAVVRTVDLFEFVHKYPERVREKKNRSDGVIFANCRWADMDGANLGDRRCQVGIVTNGPGR